VFFEDADDLRFGKSRLLHGWSPSRPLASEFSTYFRGPYRATRQKPQKRVSPRPGYIDVSEAAGPRLVGYARVSTDEQTTRLQLDALKAAGCRKIFQDKLGGVLPSRPQLDRALGELRAGDTLVVWKLDRLGRSLRNLLEIAEVLREREIALRSLTEHLDTATAAGRMLYSVLGAVAQFERDVLRERTVVGYAPLR